MKTETPAWQLDLWGIPALIGSDGQRVTISSRRGQAMLAMLALAPRGERTRQWLQSQLWNSRDRIQAQGSLRRELAQLRELLNQNETVLHADHHTVRLDLERVQLSLPKEGSLESQLLEGLSVPNEPRVAAWITDARTYRPSSQLPKLEPDSLRDISLASLAVLAFENRTGEPALNYLCDGIAEDLINGLSRYKWLRVTGRIGGLAKSTPGESVTVRDMHDVGYLLEGRILRRNSKLKVAAWLTETAHGSRCWENEVEMKDEGDPDFLQSLVIGMSGALGTQVDLQEQRKVMQRSQADRNVTSLIWRGRWHLNQLTKEHSEQAMGYFSKALELEPDSTEAALQTALAHLFEAWATRAKESKVWEVRRLAHRAIVSLPDDSRGFTIAAIAEFWLHSFPRAEFLFQEALSRNRSDTLALTQWGGLKNLLGEFDVAESILEKSLLANPRDQHRFYIFGELAFANFGQKHYLQSANQAEASISLRPSYWYAHAFRIAALEKLGGPRLGKAVEDLRINCPSFSPRHFDWLPFKGNPLIGEVRNIVVGHL